MKPTNDHNEVEAAIKDIPTQHFLHQSFRMGNVQFRSFCEANAEEAATLWKWRNHPDIRKWMYNPEVIPRENHYQFLENLPQKNNQFYWMVMEEGTHLGVINFTNFEASHTEWGFYLSPDLFGKGKSIHLIYHALNFFFKHLNLEYVYGFVRADNHIALRFHDFMDIQKTGYQEIKVSDVNTLFEKREMTQQRWLGKNMTLQNWKAKRAKEKENRKLK
ncbi:MAG: UDP-4-amino-4,6-dideoxy-N-acetyl-beta-L-altrosamine N-acetyltransferase [Bacteroidota bacterium]